MSIKLNTIVPLLEQIRIHLEGVTPDVDGFILYLTGALTSHDRKNSKKRGYNPNALSMYLGAVGKIKSDVARYSGSGEPEALDALKKAINARFLPDMPPAKATIKAIDAFLATGKTPKYGK